jgi:hypothetical protein
MDIGFPKVPSPEGGHFFSRQTEVTHATSHQLRMVPNQSPYMAPPSLPSSPNRGPSKSSMSVRDMSIVVTRTVDQEGGKTQDGSVDQGAPGDLSRSFSATPDRESRDIWSEGVRNPPAHWLPTVAKEVDDGSGGWSVSSKGTPEDHKMTHTLIPQAGENGYSSGEGLSWGGRLPDFDTWLAAQKSSKPGLFFNY